MPILRRHNEHKTRPRSLVLIRRPSTCPLRRPSSFIPPMSYAVPLRSALSPSATTRRSGLFPVGRPGWMEARPSSTGKATQHVAVVSTSYVCGQKVTEHVLFRRDIDSELCHREVSRETINYAIIGSD